MRYLEHGRSDVWFARLDGRAQRLIAPRADGPSISPTGRWVAYAKCVAADYCGDVVTQGGTISTRYVDAAIRGGPPYAVNVRTGAVRRIGSYGYSASPFGVSRDARLVLVEDRKYERLDRSQRVEIAPYVGGPPLVVARFAGSPTWNG